MDLTLTEDQQLVQQTAREVLEQWRTRAGARAVRGTEPGYSTELWAQMVELGWSGLAVDSAYGGVGLGFLEQCLLFEELGRAGTPSPLLATVACAGMPIARFGTEPQKQRWLAAIASGQVLSHARGEVSATGTADGYLLDGTAMFVPYATAAAALLVVAADATGDPAVLIVDTDTADIGVEPLEVVGIEPLYRVRFDRVPVPADRLLGGAPVAAALTAYGTAATTAEMVGGAQRVLDMTVEYATQRHQFGRPIGTFQAVQHHCADMAIDVLGARLTGYEAVWRLAAGQDADLELSCAKAWVSEAYQRVCSLGHQVHGAIGFTAEHDLQYCLRHAVATTATFGDGDFHTARIAERLGI